RGSCESDENHGPKTQARPQANSKPALSLACNSERCACPSANHLRRCPIKVPEQSEQIKPPMPPTPKTSWLRRLALPLILAVVAIAAFVLAAPAFAATPSPNPSPSSGSTTHNCPNT